MANIELHTIISDLTSISLTKGYLSFDDILDVTEKFDLPLGDVDRITDRLLTNGIILRENDNHTLSPEDEDDESGDRSKIDYDLMFDEIINECPSLKDFINEVRLIPPPQVKEVDSLIYQAMDGNEYAYDRIIKMYIKVVIRTAYLLSKQYYLPLEDAIQDGAIGLISAYESYDPTSGKRFSTQLGWIIRNAILREASTTNPLVYYPVHIKDQLFKIYDIVFEHQCEHCLETATCSALVQDISNKLNIDNKTACLYMRYLTAFESLELMLENNELIFSDNRAMEEQIIEDLHRAEMKEKISYILANLEEREVSVLKYRYGLNNIKKRTLQEVGELYGVTRERVRQIEAKTIRMLRFNKMLKEFLK